MHQMTKMNKEMKTEVKQLKSQIKSLKREVMDAKESSRKQLETAEDENVNTLKLTPQEIDELLAVREFVHAAFEKSIKSTTDCPDPKNNEEGTSNPLNLWLTNTNANANINTNANTDTNANTNANTSTQPSATSDDAIQLSRTVILYVKVLRKLLSWEDKMKSYQYVGGKLNFDKSFATNMNS